MKLLHCTGCGDVRALRSAEWATCACGKSRGRCLDGVHAVIDGDHALALALSNPSLWQAVDAEAADKETGTRRHLGHPVEAWVVPWASPRVTRPQPCPCGRGQFVGAPGMGPVACACGEWALDWHSTGGTRLLSRSEAEERAEAEAIRRLAARLLRPYDGKGNPPESDG